MAHPRLLWLSCLLAGLWSSSPAAAQTCTTSMPPQKLPLPSCPASNASLDDAKALAWRVAPVVHWHPLEPWHLQNMDDWFANAELILADYRPAGNSSYDALLNQGNAVDKIIWLTRSFLTLTNSTKLSQEQKDELLAGAGFDENGHSRAKVFYTVVDYAPGIWLYNFNLFYSFNGGSNQAWALNRNGSVQVLEYLMTPVGVHEADLERVSMLVCKADGAIKQTAYSQHGWEEMRDCEAGQCVFDDSGHPVSYAGLEGHGNYYVSSPLEVYDFYNGSSVGQGQVSLDNFGGIWVADRTYAAPNVSFVPTNSNIVYIPPLTDILEQNLTEFRWAAYPGNWGAGNVWSGQTLRVECLYDNQTRLGSCDTSDNHDTNRLLSAAINIIGKLNLLKDYEGATAFLNSTNGTVPYPSLTGPLYRPFSYLWGPDKGAPIHAKGTELVCPWDVLALEPLPDLANYSNGIDTLVTYLWGISLGAFLFSLVMVLVFALPILLDQSSTMKTIMTRTLSEIKIAGSGYAQKLANLNLLGGNSKGSGLALPPPAGTTAGTAGAAAAAAGGTAVATAADPQLPATAVLHSSNSNELHLEPNGKAISKASMTSSTPNEPSPAAATLAPAPGAELARVPSATRHVHNDAGASHVISKRSAVWALLAIGLFIAGVVLVSLGAEDFWNNSVASWASETTGRTSLLKTLKILIALGLALIGLCDLIAFIIIFLAQPKYIVVGKFRLRNYLGSYDWVNRNSFNIHIIVIGLEILVVNISAVLFALGFIVVVTQVAARIACTNLGKVDVLGITINEVCISVASIQEDPICGWQALQLCYDMSSLGVINIVLGSAMLLWSHLVWLLMLMLSLWRFYDFEVVEGGAPGSAL